MSAKCPIHHIQSEKKMNKEQKSFWEYGAAWATKTMKYTIDSVEDGVLLIGCTNHHHKVTVKKDLKYANKINASEAKEELSSWQYERR